MNWLNSIYFLAGVAMGIEIMWCIKKYGGKQNED